MSNIIDILSELGHRLSRFGEEEPSRRAIADAMAENEWFSREDILRAVDAIRSEFLCKEKLQRWMARYAPAVEPRRVAIIMAGNLPLVGFFDLMCVLAAGHQAAVKPSSKESALTRYIIATLLKIEPHIAIEEYSSDKQYDMVIATGGDDAARYFQTRYASTPTLIRGSRHSVAVLMGDESKEELEGLQRDIFTYNGLGCRNVSLVFLPQGQKLQLWPPTMGKMYRGNYLHCRAMRQMCGEAFTDFGECIAVEECAFSANISQINYCHYNTLSDVKQWLEAHDKELQCVVTHAIAHPRQVDFGRAQYPTLTDYADGVDVMEFLTT